MQFRSPLVFSHSNLHARLVAGSLLPRRAMSHFECCVTGADNVLMGGPEASLADVRRGSWHPLSRDKDSKIANWLAEPWTIRRQIWLQSPITKTLKCFLCAPPNEQGIMWCKPIDSRCSPLCRLACL